MGYRTHCLRDAENASALGEPAGPAESCGGDSSGYSAVVPEPPTDICVKFRPLVLAVVARYRTLPAGVERADLEQEANRALLELSHEYEPSRGVPLAAYLKAKLGWRVTHYLRQEKRRTGHLPLDAVDFDALPSSVVEDPTPGIGNPRVARALRRLSPRQRAVIAGIFWRERTERELASELGVSHQAVAAMRRRAEASLRKQLRPDDA